MPATANVGPEPVPLVVRERKGSPYLQSGLVFTNTFGGPIQQHPFATVWETARAGAELPTWATPHDLRHYYASLLIRSGASVKVVQSRLGHASATTTLDTYGHLFPDEADRTRAAVDEAFAVSHNESVAG